jgi:hypothetical protein
MAVTPIIRDNPPRVPPSEATPESWHGCYDGWVYLGFEGEDESGEPAEVIERVPCRRCNAAQSAEGL